MSLVPALRRQRYRAFCLQRPTYTRARTAVSPRVWRKREYRRETLSIMIAVTPNLQLSGEHFCVQLGYPLTVGYRWFYSYNPHSTCVQFERPTTVEVMFLNDRQVNCIQIAERYDIIRLQMLIYTLRSMLVPRQDRTGIQMLSYFTEAVQLLDDYLP